jgi:RNA polymerase sigma factor (sigma-70 family)
MDGRTDAELIAASFTEPDVFEALFVRYFSTIYRYLSRRVGQDLANDLAAETFVVAFGRRDRFSAQRPSALPWLYGTAGNLLRMHQRSDDRRLRAYTRASSDARIGLSDTDDADERLDAVALRPALADALAELSPSLREALALHVWAGLSDDEIAEAVGCSSEAVRTLGVLARLGWVVGLGDAEPPADLV